MIWSDYIKIIDMKTVEQSCHHCEKSFHMATKEYTRKVKLGKTVFFCSKVCFKTTTSINKNIHIPKYRIPIESREKFSFYFRQMRRFLREHGLDYDLTTEDLEKLWTGKCALSGLDIELRKSGDILHPKSASLDRIDSYKGYVKGNVQFVCVSLNYAKHYFSNAEILDFIRELKSN